MVSFFLILCFGKLDFSYRWHSFFLFSCSSEAPSVYSKISVWGLCCCQEHKITRWLQFLSAQRTILKSISSLFFQLQITLTLLAAGRCFNQTVDSSQTLSSGLGGDRKQSQYSSWMRYNPRLRLKFHLSHCCVFHHIVPDFKSYLYSLGCYLGLPYILTSHPLFPSC